MNHLISVLLPSILASFFLPELRKRKLLWFALFSIPLSYLLISVTAHLLMNVERTQASLVSVFLLAVSCGLILRSLNEAHYLAKIIHISAGLSLLITASSFTALGDELPLLSAAVGILSATTFIAGGLMADLEDQLGQSLNVDSPRGLAFLFPRHAGWVLCCLMLFGSIPGSLLFLIEDVLMHEFSVISSLGCALVLLVTTLASISSYQIYVQAFCGRNLEELPARLRREPSRALGFLLLLIVGAGLAPALFLRPENPPSPNHAKAVKSAQKLSKMIHPAHSPLQSRLQPR